MFVEKDDWVCTNPQLGLFVEDPQKLEEFLMGYTYRCKWADIVKVREYANKELVKNNQPQMTLDYMYDVRRGIKVPSKPERRAIALGVRYNTKKGAPKYTSKTFN